MKIKKQNIFRNNKNHSKTLKDKTVSQYYHFKENKLEMKVETFRRIQNLKWSDKTFSCL